MTARNGSAEWRGGVETGSGTITVGDGVFEGAYSYESRFGEAAGTNPEQLLAAAHAGCFTMALANGLSGAGHPTQSLRTNARVQLRNRDGAITLARIDLETEGDVPDIDEREFQAYAEAAKRDCPVSQALAGIPEITLTTKLRTATRPGHGAERPMSTTDRPTGRSGRTRAVSWAVARRPQRLRLVLEYLRSHDQLAKPASVSGDRQNPDLVADQGARS